jgi:hypothetical protein
MPNSDIALALPQLHNIHRLAETDVTEQAALAVLTAVHLLPRQT